MVHSFPDPPATLVNISMFCDSKSVLLRRHFRQPSKTLALASQNVEFRPSGGNWSPTVTIQGYVYNTIGNIDSDVIKSLHKTFWKITFLCYKICPVM